MKCSHVEDRFSLQALRHEDVDRDVGDHAVLSAGRQQRLLQEAAVLSYRSVLGQLQQEPGGEEERVVRKGIKVGVRFPLYRRCCTCRPSCSRG